MWEAVVGLSLESVLNDMALPRIGYIAKLARYCNVAELTPLF